MTARKAITQIIRVILIAGVTLVLIGVVQAANIDSTNKWVWGTNVGWSNFNPTHGGGVTVYSDHLEGYIWAENINWIRLGTYDAGGTHTYANDAANTYGINNDGVGNLSGYAWGTNVGWINLNPSHSQVTIDPTTGDFDGYAWAENVGWIHFQNASPAYKVNTDWRGDLASTYQNDIAAIITTRRPGPATSEGLTITNNGFLQDAGDGIIFGHNNVAFAVVTDNLGSIDANTRWADIWQLDVNDGSGATGGSVKLTFDISDAGGNAGNPFSGTGTYFLLKRATGSTGDFSEVTGATWSVSGDQLTFTVDASNLGSEFTLGAQDSPTAITLRGFTARAGTGAYSVALLVGLLALGAVGGALLLRVRRRR